MPSALICSQVVARGESSIEDDLLGLVAEHLDRTLRKLDNLGGVGRVAAFHEAIHDQPGGTAGEEHLVAVQGLVTILADDVGVRLEVRDHLLSGVDRVLCDLYQITVER